jgi:KTSC domain
MPAFPDSPISQAEYDTQTSQLRVWFRDSAEHLTYRNVPPAVYDKLVTADSKGQYFELMIRGRYPSERG